MNMKKYQLENYKKFLLNRGTASSYITDYIDNSLASEDDATRHSFHKVMVHNWNGSDRELFDALSEYFKSTFIPVNYTSQSGISTFYTSSLNLILKIVKLDFMFPHQRNMFNVDILFNDKTSADCFDNRVTIEDVVAGVVSGRLNEKFELNLSEFCNDPEFIQKKIHFYKLTLLSHFKILMLRIGRDTKILNLSNNNLSQVPVEVLNFFIKGSLIAINLSYNHIPSLSELQRISSKIEKLWVEGNPLCEDIDPVSYVKQIIIKFPRLTELDGIKLNNKHGVILPFFRNFLDPPDKRTKMLVEKFLSLYFAHYDSSYRKKINLFYDVHAKLSITSNFPDSQEHSLDHYTKYSRNILSPMKKFAEFNNKTYGNRDAIVTVLSRFPESMHDPSTFTVDVLKHDKKTLVLIIDGIFKEKTYNLHIPECFFQFRRTFVFSNCTKNNTTIEYFITNELYNIQLATKEQIDNSFKNSARSTNPLALRNPDPEDTETLCNIFAYVTKLNKPEAELRLKINGWDITKALMEFKIDMNLNKISFDRFIEDDDFSDSSSLVEDEID